MGPQMFEDQDQDQEALTDDGASTWPSLTHLEIEMACTTPDGRWYFTSDVSYTEYATNEHWYEDDSDESVAAFDSADSDTSDFAPEHRWERGDGMVPTCELRSRPDCETFDPS